MKRGVVEIVFRKEELNRKWKSFFTVLFYLNVGFWIGFVYFVGAIPVLTGVVLNSTSGNNLTEDNLTVYTDQDSNNDEDSNNDQDNNVSLKLIYDWRKNGVSIAVLNMPFENNTANVSATTRDYSSYENNGTVNATYNSTGGHDGKGAYVFDGNDDYLRIPHNFSLDFVGSYSISVWINQFADDSATIISKGAEEVSLKILPNHQIQFQWREDVYFRTPLEVFNDDEWIHIIAVYDNSDNGTVYVNSVDVGGTQVGSGTPANTTTDLFIGQRSSFAFNFNGSIDDVMIFNHSLSAEQVSTFYNNRADLIVSQETSVGENWSCEVTPNDGESDGVSLLSEELVILETPSIQISIVYPQNTSYGVNVTSLSYTVVNISLLDTCWYSLDDGATNVTVTCEENVTGLVSDEGGNMWTIYINDTTGNESLASVYFVKDTTSPSITINSPLSVENVSRLEAELNVTISENGSIWYNLDDSGNVSLCIECSNGNSTLSFVDYGNHSVIVYANDSLGNLNFSEFNFSLNLDSDGDGVPDSEDSDDDNDGIHDDNDTLTGDLSNVNTNIDGLNLSIGGSGNLSVQLSGLLVVNFSHTNGTVLSFSHNFSSNQTLVLGNITISTHNSSSDVGHVLVRGINLTAGQTKTVYLENVHAGKNSVCIEDRQLLSISEISGDCSDSGEVRLSCPGTSGDYVCTDLGSRYKIEGLSHSGVIETSDAVVEEADSGASSGGSGGGCVYDKDFDWGCSEWSECVAAGFQVRVCKEKNNCGSYYGIQSIKRDCEIDVKLFEELIKRSPLELIVRLASGYGAKFYIEIILIISFVLIVVWRFVGKNKKIKNYLWRLKRRGINFS